MTVESPRSPEVEKELRKMLDELFLDEFEPRCTYKEGAYMLKANRALEDWEKAGLDKLMKSAVSADGVQTLPIHLQLHITETDQDVLEAIEMEEDQTFDFEINSSGVLTTVAQYDLDEMYYIGVAIYCDEEFPLLQYETNFEAGGNELAAMLQDLYEKIGPSVAENEIFIKNGKKTILLDESFEYMNRGVYFPCAQIYHGTVDQWGLSNNQDDAFEGAKDFLTGTGFSSNMISYLLYPYLSRDAVSYEVTGLEI